MTISPTARSHSLARRTLGVHLVGRWIAHRQRKPLPTKGAGVRASPEPYDSTRHRCQPQCWVVTNAENVRPYGNTDARAFRVRGRQILTEDDYLGSRWLHILHTSELVSCCTFCCGFFLKFSGHTLSNSFLRARPLVKLIGRVEAQGDGIRWVTFLQPFLVHCPALRPELLMVDRDVFAKIKRVQPFPRCDRPVFCVLEHPAPPRPAQLAVGVEAGAT